MTRPARLYLDAARLGAMSPTAQLAAGDFARLAGEGLSTLYWEEFFRKPSFRLARFPALADWRGIPGVQDSIRALLAASPQAPVLLSSRTRALMQAATESLATQCRCILTTDSLWPEYRNLLEASCRRQDSRIVTVPIRASLFRSELSSSGMLTRIAGCFVANACDGVLLSSLSHDGLRIPLTAVVRAIRERNSRAMIVVDGAQEFAHVPVDLVAAPCDVYVAGCHQWLGGDQPLGVALLANSRTAERIRSLFHERLNDPLFDYVRSLLDAATGTPAETVNLAPLVCAHGALRDYHGQPSTPARRFRRQQSNARRLSALAPSCGWTPRYLPPELRSGIVLLQRRHFSFGSVAPPTLERALSMVGITATAYRQGVIRLSLPPLRLSCGAWKTLRDGLKRVAELAVDDGQQARNESVTPSPTESAPTTAGTAVVRLRENAGVCAIIGGDPRGRAPPMTAPTTAEVSSPVLPVRNSLPQNARAAPSR